MLLDFYKPKEQDWYDKNLDIGIGVVTGAIAGWVGGFITGGFGW